MTRIVQPDEFRSVFLGRVEGLHSELLACWSSSPDYTRFMLDKASGALKQIAADLRLEYYREYWTIDAVLYAEADKENLGYGTYAKSLAVAIEHENDWASAHEEMNKLSMIDSSLKVLITYPRTDAQRVSMLQRFAGMLKAADTFGDFGDKRRHLVVSGFRSGDEVSWRFDLYDGADFVELAG